jgi:glucokinase
MTADVVGALDIGGTHVTAGRVRISAATVEPEARVRLEYAGGAPLLERILEAAGSVATVDTRRFGVAAPGPFDYARGVCLVSHKLPGLYGVDLRRELAAALELPGEAVSFLNDAEAFVLGEWWAGAARGHERVVGITLGTGLGSAFLDDGGFVREGPDVPAEGALWRLAFRDAPVEDTISRRALLRRYDALLVSETYLRDRPCNEVGTGTVPVTPLTEGLSLVHRAESSPDVEQIAECARAGERRACHIFEQLGADLAEFLAPIVEAFAPTCVVVGGSIAHAWELFASPLTSVLAADGRLIVACAARIDDAPLLGAARHAAGQP